ncbi:type III-B CRISPR module-associated Cmr3 family protein, partial [Acinetobacter johnsonii]
MTHFYLVESLSPLVFRAGKPFGAQAYQTDANFPLPSSAAGLIRALYLDQKNIPFEGKLDKRATLSEQ